MTLAVTRETIPLATDAHGVSRIAGTRVSLDVVVHAFDAGASPEEIADSFPVLSLADVYATITYVLRHRAEVDAYLAKQAAEARELRARLEEQYPTANLRRKLLARAAG